MVDSDDYSDQMSGLSWHYLGKFKRNWVIWIFIVNGEQEIFSLVDRALSKVKNRMRELYHRTHSPCVEMNDHIILSSIHLKEARVCYSFLDLLRIHVIISADRCVVPGPILLFFCDCWLACELQSNLNIIE